MHLSVSELTQAKCVTPALNSKLKSEKLIATVRVLQNTQNLVMSRCYFSEDGYEMYKDLHVHSHCMFYSVNLLFGDVLVAVAVAVCSRVSNTAEEEEILDEECWMRVRKIKAF